jgi:hypothetical protein
MIRLVAIERGERANIEHLYNLAADRTRYGAGTDADKHAASELFGMGGYSWGGGRGVAYYAGNDEHSPSGEWCEGCNEQIEPTYCVDIMGWTYRDSRGELQYRTDGFTGAGHDDFGPIYAYRDNGDGRPVKILTEEGAASISAAYEGAGYSTGYVARALDAWRDEWRNGGTWDEDARRWVPMVDSFGLFFKVWHRANVSPELPFGDLVDA